MAEEQKDQKNQEHVVNLSGEVKGQDAWMQALKELEKASVVPAQRAQKKVETPAPAAPEKPAVQGHRPPGKNAPAPELMTAAFRTVQEAQDQLAAFTSKHPYLIAPNVYKLMEEHLRETVFTMNRELDRRLNGRVTPQEGGGDS